MKAFIALLFFAVTASAQMITHYGAADDSTLDSNSAARIGNHDNILVPLQSAALTEAGAKARGVNIGDSFSVPGKSGNTYNLIYADTVPATYTDPKTGVVTQLGDRIDIFDPNNVLGSANGWSDEATGFNTGPVLQGSGVTNTGPVGGTQSFQHSQMPPFISTLLAKFQNTGKAWVQPIKQATTSLFWILALISLAITGVWMALKHADLMEIMAELVRYILFTGLFWWLLTSAPDLPGKIIASLWQVGGQASGSGNEIFPGDLVTLASNLFSNQMSHANWFTPQTVFIAGTITLGIFILCVLVAANVVLLLCAAWVVLFAGMILLGFGGCRWTSDMAVHYYRTILGIGLSLMTSLLIMGIATKFMQDMITAAGPTPDIPNLASILGAALVVLFISHKLPKIISEMAIGGGWNGHVGGHSVLALLSLASLTGRGVATGGAAVAQTVMSSQEKLRNRLAVLPQSRNGNGKAP